MNKATYDRIMTEVEERTRANHGDKLYCQEEILELVSVSIKVAIAEELLNRNCCKDGR